LEKVSALHFGAAGAKATGSPQKPEVGGGGRPWEQMVVLPGIAQKLADSVSEFLHETRRKLVR
jgi:hypothetical protein